MPKQTADLPTIVTKLAHAAQYSRQAHLHLQALLPMVYEVCPEFYESFAHLIIGAFQSWQTLEAAGDDMLGITEIEGQPVRRVHGVDPLPVVLLE